MDATIRKFFLDRGWHMRTCTSCGSQFFSKLPDASTCDWRECSSLKYTNQEGEYIRSRNPRKCMLSMGEVQNKIVERLADLLGPDTSVLIQPLNIANKHGSTDAAIAGVQIFDKDFIHANAIVDVRRICAVVSQASVRNYSDHVNLEAASSSAFINLCIERCLTTLNEHLESIDHMLTALSKVGISANDITIRYREKVRDWGNGSFTARELFFIHKGLELGDAMFAWMPTKSGNSITISDVGFGLERIVFALNDTRYYYDNLVPPLSNFDQFRTGDSLYVIDDIRTAVLMIMNGIKPGARGVNSRLRRHIKTIAKVYNGGSLQRFESYVLFFFEQWISVGVQNWHGDFYRLMHALLSYIDGETIAYLQKTIPGAPSPLENETLEQYEMRIVRNGITSYDNLKLMRDSIYGK